MTSLRTASPLREQLRQHVGAGIEFLNAVIAHVDDIDRPVGLIDGDPARKIELPVTISEAAPGHDEFAAHIELLDTEVCAIDDIDIAAHPIDRDAPRRVKLAFAVPARAELHDVATQFPVELLHAVIVRIDHVDVTFRITGNARRIVKVRIGGSKISPQDDEVPGAVELLDHDCCRCRQQRRLPVDRWPVHTSAP